MVERAAWTVWTDVEVNVSQRTYSRGVSEAGGLPLLLPADEPSAESPDSCSTCSTASSSPAGGHRPGQLRRGARIRRRGAPGPSATASSSRSATAALARGCRCWASAAACSCSNVACGGTLEQHLPDAAAAATCTRRGTLLRPRRAAGPGSRAARAVGAERVSVQVAPPPGRRQARGRADGERAGRSPATRSRRSSSGEPGRWGSSGMRRRTRRSPVDRGAGRGRDAGWGLESVIEVVEPATERVMAEIPRAGAEEVDAAVARGEGGLPGLAGGRAGRPGALLRAARRAIVASREELATLEARNAGKPIGDARGEIAMVVEMLPLLRGRARAAARPHDPGRRRGRHDLPRAARRRRPDRALELPAGDRLLEGGPGARGRQHRRAQARRADAADGGRAGAHRARGRAAGGRAQRDPGPGRVCGNRLVEHPDVAKIAFTGSTEVGRAIAAGAAQTIKRVTLELGGKSANVVFADADLERRRGGGPGRRVRQRRAGLLRALADPRRAQRDRRLHGGARARRHRDRVGDPLDEATQMGPLISAGQRETVASYVPDDAPVAIRGEAPDGPGYWFPPTVLAPDVELRPRRDRGDLRPGGLRDPVRGRGGGDPARERDDLRALRLDLDARRRAGRCAWRGRSTPACCRSTRTARCG